MISSSGAILVGTTTMQPQPGNSELLDKLCFFRGLYARRGVDDSEVTLSVEAAVVYGEGLLRHMLSIEKTANGQAQPAD
jgi:hypothetical protein